MSEQFWGVMHGHIKYKRFTDAELAAESYKAQTEFVTILARSAPIGADPDDAYAKHLTFYRFATTPNYDEVPA
jgi:hypothetical protein